MTRIKPAALARAWHLIVALVAVGVGLATMANTFWHSGHLASSVQVASLVSGTGLASVGTVVVIFKEAASIKAYIVRLWPDVTATLHAIDTQFPSVQDRLNQLDNTVAQRIADVATAMTSNGVVATQVKAEVLQALAAIGVLTTDQLSQVLLGVASKPPAVVAPAAPAPAPPEDGTQPAPVAATASLA